MPHPRKISTRNLTARYLIAVAAVALLALGNYAILSAQIRSAESAAEFLNLTSRQRTLAQYAVFLAQELATTDDLARKLKTQSDLKDTIKSLEAVHHRLAPPRVSPRRNGASQSDAPHQITRETVRSVYEDAPWLLDTEVRNFLAQLQTLVDSPPEEWTADNPNLRYVRDVTLTHRVTDGLDAVVAAYQAQSEADATRLHYLAYWSMISTYVVLGLSVVLVFQPMVRRVESDMASLEEWNETLETRVEERTAQLLQSERLAAIGQMVAGVAHESRNALQEIRACAQLLEWRIGDDHEGREIIGDIARAEARLLRLFEDLRGYASPGRLERQPCQLDEIVNRAWDSVDQLRQGRDARLEQKHGAADLTCQVDPFQMEQVYRNLIENSLAACNDPVKIEVDYQNGQETGADRLRVTLRDNGPGIAEQDADRIFEPFYTTKTQGSGLGMAIVRRIVESHGGTIDVQRRCGPGAEFVMTLPKRTPCTPHSGS
jgi:signal transduction histidine kinase